MKSVAGLGKLRKIDTAHVVVNKFAQNNFNMRRLAMWISVNERLPELSRDVLMRVTCRDHFNVEQGEYCGNGAWINCWSSTRNKGLYPVTHWMPLPALPTENATEGDL